MALSTIEMLRDARRWTHVALFSSMIVVILAGCSSGRLQAIPAPTIPAPAAPGPSAVRVTEAVPTAAASDEAATVTVTSAPASDKTAAPSAKTAATNVEGVTSEPASDKTAALSDEPTTPSAEPAATNAEPAATNDNSVTVERPEGWTEETHGSDVEPNYGVVFPQDTVHQVKITLTAEDWAAMQANITELLGKPGTGGGPGGRGGFPGGGNVQPPADGQAPQGGAPQGMPEGGQPPMGGGFRGGIGRNPDMTPTNPSWFPATVAFNGQTWTDVGVRYKGNSSLTSAWRSGSDKLPLKLDFDQFEDEVPAVDNQRFYGFKQLSLGNAFRDGTYMHDALAYDLFRAAGMVAPQTAFYEVIVDYGEGSVSLGLYTMVEVVDDTVIETAFDGDSGNIYEADGSAASLAKGTAGAIEASFQKENNEQEADWSDIQALYDVLHADERTTSPETWRTELEAVLDVDSFLKTLAMNAVIQDWDQYGAMNHNYYLYHDPATDKLTWISWDHNEAFSGGRGGPGGRGGGRGATSLDQANISENWPLIRFLLDDEVYSARYKEYLAGALKVFDSDELAGRIDEMAKLLRPYAAKEGNESGFNSAVEQLKTTIATQEKAVQSFLAK